MNALTRLQLVKVIHTLAWAFFVACIAGIIAAAWWSDLRVAGMLIAVVAVEVGILALNHWRCPLTDVAARYTSNRRPNFDIYLPEWLARYNKEIFGAAYMGGVVLTIIRWVTR